MAGELASAIGLSYGAETPRGGSGGDKILGSILAENRRKAAEQAKRDAERDQRLKDIMKETSIDTDLDSRYRVEWEKESARRIDNIVQGYISEDVNTRVNASKQLYDLKAIKNNLQTQSDNYRKARAFAQQNPDAFSIGEYRKGDKTYTNIFEVFDDVDNIDNADLAQFSTLGAQFGLGTYKGSDGGETTVLQTNFNPVKMDTYDRLLNSSIKPEDYVITDVRKQKLGGRTYEYDEGELPEERRAALRAQVMQDPNYLLSYKQKAWQEYNKANQDVKGFTPFAEWMNSPESKVSDQSFVSDVNTTLGRKKQMGQRSYQPPSSGGGYNRANKWTDVVWQDSVAGTYGFQTSRRDAPEQKIITNFNSETYFQKPNGQKAKIGENITTEAVPKGVVFDVKGGNKTQGKFTAYAVYAAKYDPDGEGRDVYNTFYVPLTKASLAGLAGNLSMQPEELLQKAKEALPDYNKYEVEIGTDVITATLHGKNKPVYPKEDGRVERSGPSSLTPTGATQGKVFKPRGSQ